MRRSRALCICLFFTIFCARLSALDPHQPLRQFHHTSWTSKDGLSGSVMALAQTPDGYLWVGTSDGLFRFDGLTFDRYKLDSGTFTEGGVSALFATSDDGLWIGYEFGGVSLLKNGRLTNYAPAPGVSIAEGLPNNTVKGFALTPDGTIWVATVGGLARLESGRWRGVGLDWEHRPNQVQRPFVDRQGNLWVADISGVKFLAPGLIQFQPAETDGSFVRSISQAGDGTIWCAGDGKFVQAIRTRPLGPPACSRHAGGKRPWSVRRPTGHLA